MNDSRNSNHCAGDFIEKLLDWHTIHARTGLPWTGNPDPYLIWISEIMLQQTRVSTVIPYFQKFMEIFPNIVSLADAPLDQVLNLWSGLGYYSRARNLHAAAKEIKNRHDGCFPENYDEILDLPGIGKSTAGAICALAFEMRTAILDANAKRVYSRVYCVDEASESIRNRKLWEIADSHTSDNHARQYTQAIMDLGATVCLPSIPLCHSCPVAKLCCASQRDLTHQYPFRKKSAKRDTRNITMVMAVDQTARILLERRPPRGIWGGLWSFPEYAGTPENLREWFKKRYLVEIVPNSPWPPVQHEFTHFRLNISPLPARVVRREDGFDDNARFMFFDPKGEFNKGLPAPVATLMSRIDAVANEIAADSSNASTSPNSMNS